MEQTLTISIQDYLKNIYQLTENGEAASTNALAKKLNISPPSVTGMMQKLATTKPALVEYQKHQGVTLTKDGKRLPSRSSVITVCWKHGWFKRLATHGMKSMKRQNALSMLFPRISKGALPGRWDIPPGTRTVS